MGIFDFPAPIFYFIDNSIGFLPDFLRLLAWGILGGVLSMVFYALLSPQTKISEVKVALREAQGLLATSDDSFDDLWQLIKKTLSLSFRHLMLVFIPALLSSLPLICILAWASSQFGYQFPEPGEHVTLSAQPVTAASKLSWQIIAVNPEFDGSSWEFEWPDEAQSFRLDDEDGNILLEIPPTVAVPQIHKRLWWNSWLGNPLGYLPQQSPVDSVNISLPAKHYLSIGPAWVRSWLMLFFIAVMFSALMTKWLFKIH
jgi:hypothetical protein